MSTPPSTRGSAAAGNPSAGGAPESRAPAVETRRSLHRPRRSEAKPADVVIYGVPAWSPYATFARMNPLLTLVSSGLGYLGGYIEALGKPGCSVIMASPCPDDWDLEHHPAHADVWKRVLPPSRDPYAIRERFGGENQPHPGLIERYRFPLANRRPPPVRRLVAPVRVAQERPPREAGPSSSAAVVAFG